ncbi:unnamed protein product [[Candida] boidinii]|nr:unnamed protein product [[Candida] boidinii]
MLSKSFKLFNPNLDKFKTSNLFQLPYGLMLVNAETSAFLDSENETSKFVISATLTSDKTLVLSIDPLPFLKLVSSESSNEVSILSC